MVIAIVEATHDQTVRHSSHHFNDGCRGIPLGICVVQVLSDVVYMLGPGVIRTEQQAAALIHMELDRHRGRTPVFLVPVDRYGLVRQMYDWGARNCELHFCQVRGRFQPYQGINMPTFLLETA